MPKDTIEVTAATVNEVERLMLMLAVIALEVELLLDSS